MVVEGVKKEYEDEINEIISEYKRVGDEYSVVSKEIGELKKKLNDLELKSHSLTVEKEIIKKREKDFFNLLKDKDFQAYLIIERNIDKFITQKINGE